MKNVPVRTDVSVSRLACRDEVRVLIARYGWNMPPEDELVERVLRAAQKKPQPGNLERLIITQYTMALYEACRHTADADRCNCAYADLFRYLYRAAAKRWPNIAEEVAQRGLMLTFELIDTCRSPATFLSFALWQLRRAHTDVMRGIDPAVPLEEIDPAAAQLLLAMAASPLDPECLEFILEALQSLPVRPRQAIFLKFFRGLNDVTIGARMGESPGNVRVLRTRGLKQLRADERLREICTN